MTESNNGDQKAHRCPTCGQSVGEREIVLYQGLVVALARVYRWLLDRRDGYRFTMREVRHLLSTSEYARFGDWVLFGGLVFKERKAHYGLNLERCRDFFEGRLAIPIRLWKNPMTGEIEKSETRTVGEIPRLLEMLNEEGLFVTRYRDPVQLDLL